MLDKLVKRIRFVFRNFKKSAFENSTNLGYRYLADPYHEESKKLSKTEIDKPIKRYDIINFCLAFLQRETVYLEIGVRNPEDNFNKINATVKYSVDPGFENLENPVDFTLTSDEFFSQLRKGEVLDKDIRFDAIFIDGLHLADQVERDIENALKYIKEDGFIFLHDCNPPTEFHAREQYGYALSPASGFWNGTTWKAFFKYRTLNTVHSCCIDTDWGVGVLHKRLHLAPTSSVHNPFFEYQVLKNTREDSLGLVSFEAFKKMLS